MQSVGNSQRCQRLVISKWQRVQNESWSIEYQPDDALVLMMFAKQVALQAASFRIRNDCCKTRQRGSAAFELAGKFSIDDVVFCIAMEGCDAKWRLRTGSS